MKNEKIVRSFNLDKNDSEIFAITTKLLGDNMSNIIGEFIKNYNIIHKAQINEKLLNNGK